MVAVAQSVRALDCGSETAGGGQRRSSLFQRVTRSEQLSATAYNAAVGTACDTVDLRGTLPERANSFRQGRGPTCCHPFWEHNVMGCD